MILDILCIIAGIPYKSPSNCGFSVVVNLLPSSPCHLEIFFRGHTSSFELQALSQEEVPGFHSTRFGFFFSCRLEGGYKGLFSPCLVTKSRKTFTPFWSDCGDLDVKNSFFYFFRRCVVDENGRPLKIWWTFQSRVKQLIFRHGLKRPRNQSRWEQTQHGNLFPSSQGLKNLPVFWSIPLSSLECDMLQAHGSKWPVTEMIDKTMEDERCLVTYVICQNKICVDDLWWVTEKVIVCFFKSTCTILIFEKVIDMLASKHRKNLTPNFACLVFF